MSEKIERVVYLFRFSSSMKVYQTEEDALEAFSEPAPAVDEAPEDRFCPVARASLPADIDGWK
jgi:hypothetical protein